MSFLVNGLKVHKWSCDIEHTSNDFPRLTHRNQDELPPFYKYHKSPRLPGGSSGGQLNKTVGTKRP